MSTALRQSVVDWCYWSVAHQPWFRYLEARPFELYEPTGSRYIWDDCAATSILMLWLAGAPEPFPGAYAGIGNTESFGELEHVTTPLPADFVVYGLGLPLRDQHMAVVVEAGDDPLTMSHGWFREPALVPVSRGCPPQAQGIVTYVRCLPVVPPTPAPTLEDDMIWLDNDPNNQAAILVVPGRGGWYGLDAGTLAYFKANGVPAAKVKISKAEFNNPSFSKLGTI